MKSATNGNLFSKILAQKTKGLLRTFFGRKIFVMVTNGPMIALNKVLYEDCF